MLDSNVLDALLADPEMRIVAAELTRQGRLQLLITHVQVDELRRIPDHKADKRESLLAILDEVPIESVPTGVAVSDYSRFDLARFGSPESNALFERLRRTSRDKHTMDALIAITAHVENSTFVSEDARAVKSAKSEGLLACSTKEMFTSLKQISGESSI